MTIMVLLKLLQSVEVYLRVDRRVEKHRVAESVLL